MIVIILKNSNSHEIEKNDGNKTIGFVFTKSQLYPKRKQNLPEMMLLIVE